MIFGTLFLLQAGCSPAPVSVDFDAGIPDEIYKPLPVYGGPTATVGSLTEGYIQNTQGLITANSRLRTICVARRVCLESQ